MAGDLELQRLVVRLIGDGTSLRRMLFQAQAATKQTATVITEAGTRIERIQGKLESLASSAQRVGTQLTRVGAIMSAALTAPLAALAIKSATSFAEYQRGLAKIQGLAGASAAEIRMFDKAIRNLAPTLGKMPAELAEGMYFIRSGSGMTGGRAVEALSWSAKAAAAGLGETKDIADAATAAMYAYSKSNLTAKDAVETIVAAVRSGKAEVSEFAPVFGRLTPLANQANISFSELAATLAHLTLASGDAPLAAAQVRGLLSVIPRLGLTTVRMNIWRKVVERTNYSVEQLQNTLHTQGLTAAIIELDAVMKKAGIRMESMFYDVEAKTGFAQIINNLKQQYQIMDEQSKRSGIVTNALSTMAETLGYKWSQMTAKFKLAMINLGDMLAPTFEKMIAKIESLISWFDKLSPAAKKAVVVFAAITAGIGPLLIAMGTLIWSLGMLGTGLTYIIGLGATFVGWLRGTATATAAVAAATEAETVATTTAAAATEILNTVIIEAASRWTAYGLAIAGTNQALLAYQTNFTMRSGLALLAGPGGLATRGVGTAGGSPMDEIIGYRILSATGGVVGGEGTMGAGAAAGGIGTAGIAAVIAVIVAEITALVAEAIHLQKVYKAFDFIFEKVKQISQEFKNAFIPVWQEFKKEVGPELTGMLKEIDSIFLQLIEASKPLIESIGDLLIAAMHGFAIVLKDFVIPQLKIFLSTLKQGVKAVNLIAMTLGVLFGKKAFGPGRAPSTAGVKTPTGGKAEESSSGSAALEGVMTPKYTKFLPPEAKITDVINGMLDAQEKRRAELWHTSDALKIMELRQLGVTAAQEGVLRIFEHTEFLYNQEKAWFELTKEVKGHTEALAMQVATMGLSERAAKIREMELKGATAGMTAQAKAFADLLDWYDKEKKQIKERTDLIKQYMTPAEKYADKIKELQSVLDWKGADRGTYARAVQALNEEFNKIEQKELNIPVRFEVIQQSLYGSAEYLSRLAEYKMGLLARPSKTPKLIVPGTDIASADPAKVGKDLSNGIKQLVRIGEHFLRKEGITLQPTSN